MKKLLYKTIQVLILLSSCCLSKAQILPDSFFIRQEEEFADTEQNRLLYWDSSFDTLSFDGQIYFFRRSPLTTKKGYTKIIPEMFTVRVFGFGPRPGKGYSLLWQVRNDSLFIAEIYPTYGDLLAIGELWSEETQIVSRDTVIPRLEAFAGNRFKDGLLFVDWISGDFPMLKASLTPTPPEEKPLSWILEFTDFTYPPLLLRVKNGIVKGIKKDKKGMKEWTKMGKWEETAIKKKE